MSASDEGFEWFFRAEYEAVLRTCTLIMRERARAEDVTQEAFAKLLNHWDRVSRYDHPDAWVRRVAVRLAIKTSRRDRMRESLERQRETPVETQGSDRSLIDVIAGLPPAQKAAIILFYYEDRPTSEVARILDCSESTARVHLHKARKKLAVLMQEEVTDVT